jgi:hypothetical protein
LVMNNKSQFRRACFSITIMDEYKTVNGDNTFT